MPRKCTVCTHKQGKAISKAIYEGASLRNIALQYGPSFQTILRHTQNCLKTEISAIVEENRSEQALDTIKHFETLLGEAQSALEAAKASLMVDGKLEFGPRAWEVQVSYQDLNDRNQQGDPKLKMAALSDLLAKIEDSPDLIPQHSFVKIQDCRKTYLDTISKVESLLDKFAKIARLYDAKEVPDDVMANLERIAKIAAASYGTTITKELQYLRDNFGTMLPPDVSNKLASEMEM